MRFFKNNLVSCILYIVLYQLQAIRLQNNLKNSLKDLHSPSIYDRLVSVVMER